MMLFHKEKTAAYKFEENLSSEKDIKFELGRLYWELRNYFDAAEVLLRWAGCNYLNKI